MLMFNRLRRSSVPIVCDVDAGNGARRHRRVRSVLPQERRRVLRVQSMWQPSLQCRGQVQEVTPWRKSTCHAGDALYCTISVVNILYPWRLRSVSSNDLLWMRVLSNTANDLSACPSCVLQLEVPYIVGLTHGRAGLSCVGIYSKDTVQ